MTAVAIKLQIDLPKQITGLRIKYYKFNINSG